MNEQVMIKVEEVAKQYRLGAIGGTSFREEIQRLSAKLTKKDDPTLKVGQKAVLTKEKFWALNGVSFEIKKGEAVGIIGHNGAGKSTLLKLLCRVTAPTKGTISYNGRIASMLEVGTGFHPELTGRENIYMNGAILGMTRKEIDSKMEEIIEFSECRQFIDTPVKRYSSGMYVKLAFSVAAHLDADIMIMDEVLAVGDMKFQQKCLTKMREAATQQGKTVLYVSHNMATISKLCDRCIVLSKGKVIFDGNASDGIKVYMDSGEDTEISKKYSEEIRPSWLATEDMLLETMEFIDRDNNVFVDDEIVKVKFRWKNIKQISNLCLRWQINTQDGIPIGTSIIENFYDGAEGEYGEITLAYNLAQVMPGKYSSYVKFYYKDESGSVMELDCVSGLSFERKLVEKHKVDWDARYWGNVLFDEPQVIK